MAQIGLANIEAALGEIRKTLGDSRVRMGTNVCDHRWDEYANGGAIKQKIAGIVEPMSVEEVQATVRIAQQFKVSLWPISRGRNFGYGSAEPILLGSVMLDLGRMNRILNVDERSAFCELEPGVSFFDLFDYLQKNKIPLWMSVPGHGWGSVIGNALERGLGYTPYGNHSSKLCGLEVVLSDGSVVRTGMGAMAASKCWHHYQPGFGPSWDQMFLQSNLGVVTRAGLWLMPQPEATMRTRIELPKLEDISAAVDAISPLRLRNVIEHPVVIGSYLHDAAVSSQRSYWYHGSGAIPDDVAGTIMSTLGKGYWSLSVMHFGYSEVIRAQAKIVADVLAASLNKEARFETWTRGEPIGASAAALPGNEGLRVAKWHGGSGDHIDFSPVFPSDGNMILNSIRNTMRRFEEFGIDYCASFILGERHVTNINTILFDGEDSAMTNKASNLFQTLITDRAAEGIGVYRTPVKFMEQVANTFDFNSHAMRRLNELLKKALDPDGIFAQGKNGIWSRR